MAYGRTKLYNILFTHALSERIEQSKGLVMSLHPGVVRTAIFRNPVDTEIQQFFFSLITPFLWIGTKDCVEGAQTTLHLLFTDSKNLKNGGYYADCELSKESPLVNKENWEKLWSLSEGFLNI